MKRAWRKRCPQCGDGELFAGYARLKHECETCGLVFRRESGAMTGSMYLSAVATELFAALMIAAIWLCTHWSVATSLAVSLSLLAVFTYWWLPHSIALWVGIEYATDVHNGESWAKPR
jgi:uncharacterized protein (DUF983 family)